MLTWVQDDRHVGDIVLLHSLLQGDFGKVKPCSSCGEDGKWDPDYSQPAANAQMLEAPTCRNPLLCFCGELVCPSGFWKKSFLLGTYLLSHYIDSSIDFSGLFGFLFSCLAILAKLGINHFSHLRVIRAWIIIDIVIWFFKLPLTFSNLPGLKCLLVHIIQTTASQCKLPNVTWEKVTEAVNVSFRADWGYAARWGGMELSWHTLAHVATPNLFWWVRTWYTGYFVAWMSHLHAACTGFDSDTKVFWRKDGVAVHILNLKMLEIYTLNRYNFCFFKQHWG